MSGGLPSNVLKKPNSGGGSVPSSARACAILAPCSGGGAGNTNVATSWNSPTLAQQTFLAGPLVEMAAYEMDNVNGPGLPVVLVKTLASTPGTYSGPRMAPATILSVANGPPAVMTTVAAHLLRTGDVVVIAGSLGDTVINGTWVVTVLTATTFSIPVTGTGSYTASSGAVTPTGISYIGTGTAVPSPGSATLIADDYNALATSTPASPIPAGLAGFVLYVVTGGILGVAGITYVYSLDGGNSVSAIQALGTALTVSPTEPVTGADTGIRITLGTATSTLSAQDYFSVQTTGPRMTSSDLVSALGALFATKLNFDDILIHGEAAAALVSSVVQPWILTLEGTGRYATAFANLRFKNQVTAETETAYATAIATSYTSIMGAGAAPDVVLGADGGACVSSLTGVTKMQPTSLYAIARVESNDIGVDPAEVDLGPLPNCNLNGPTNLSAFHDENRFNTLDTPGGPLLVTTLRSFDGLPGAYITNCYLLGGPSSPYVYVQHNETMNAACTLIDVLMVQLLSKGVPRNLKTSTILEPTAQAWERFIQKQIDKVLAGQVSGSLFSISRTDVFTGNGPQTVHYTFQLDDLVYVKSFNGVSTFVSALP